MISSSIFSQVLRIDKILQEMRELGGSTCDEPSKVPSEMPKAEPKPESKEDPEEEPKEDPSEEPIVRKAYMPISPRSTIGSGSLSDREFEQMLAEHDFLKDDVPMPSFLVSDDEESEIEEVITFDTHPLQQVSNVESIDYDGDSEHSLVGASRSFESSSIWDRGSTSEVFDAEESLHDMESRSFRSSISCSQQMSEYTEFADSYRSDDDSTTIGRRESISEYENESIYSGASRSYLRSASTRTLSTDECNYVESRSSLGSSSSSRLSQSRSESDSEESGSYLSSADTGSRSMTGSDRDQEDSAESQSYLESKSTGSDSFSDGDEEEWADNPEVNSDQESAITYNQSGIYSDDDSVDSAESRSYEAKAFDSFTPSATEFEEDSVDLAESTSYQDDTGADCQSVSERDDESSFADEESCDPYPTEYFEDAAGRMSFESRTLAATSACSISGYEVDSNEVCKLDQASAYSPSKDLYDSDEVCSMGDQSSRERTFSIDPIYTMSAGSRARKVQVSVDEEGVDAIYSLGGDSKDISTQDEAGENQLDDRSVSSRSSGCTESGSIAGYTEREALTAALNAVSIDGLGQIIDAEGDSASILSIGSRCYEAEIIFVDEFLPKSLDADSRIVEEGMVHDRSDMFRPLRVVETLSCECDGESVQEQTVRIEYRCYDGITVEAVIIESEDELRKKRTSGSYESAPTFDTSQIEKKDSSFDNTIPSPPACDEESVDTPYMTMQNPDERSVLMASGSINKITEGRDEINDDLEQATNDVEVASNTAPGSEATRLQDIIDDKGVATAVSLDEPHGPDSLVLQATSRAEDDDGETSWSDTCQPAWNNDLSHAEFVRGDTNEYETGGRSDKENKRIDSDGEVKSNRRGDIGVKGSGSSKVEGREQKERDLLNAECPVHTKNIDRNHDYVNVVADDDLSACIYEALSCDSFDSEISIGNLDDHVHRILSGLNGTYAGTTSLALN